jgi:hypothetical protein
MERCLLALDWWGIVGDGSDVFFMELQTTKREISLVLIMLYSTSSSP